MSYFIVTGATSGIGKELATILASMGKNLLIVARNEASLANLANDLMERFKIDAVPVPLDLSEKNSARTLYEKCRPYVVSGLVNNAGMGLFGDFPSIDWKAEERLLQLNMVSVHELCKYFLKDFSKQNQGMVLNVASTAAFQAGPFMASYYASKAYVLSLTEAIAEEMSHLGKNITVSCLAPGPVRTGFHERAGISAGDKRLPTAEEVAVYGINQWFKGQVLIVPGRNNRWLLCLNRLIPRRLGRLVVKRNQLKKKI